ncbi:conjugal transfer protein TraB [Streptomyces sp. NPDC048281]|uniref:conjugal transfer protein TraB n=1 Tax=Streptomyces sp. NPDC048281 TaxID=3154715 RepID=UPI00341E7295
MNASTSYSSQVPAGDGDNSYQAVQAKLLTLAQALDSAQLELDQLLLRQKLNAKESEELAAHIGDAELDPVFVEMQNLVSVALGGAEVAVRTMTETAREMAAKAHDTKATHARLYEALDRIRNGRRVKTPRPAFFDN